jgi:hypothetical protein
MVPVFARRKLARSVERSGSHRLVEREGEMSLIGQQANIVLQAIQTVMGFLIIEQALHFHLGGSFALYLLAGSVSPNDANAGATKYNFPLDNLHFAVVEMQIGEVRLQKCRGFGGGGHPSIAPAAARWICGRRNRGGENRQMCGNGRDRQENPQSIHHSQPT